jgi:PAS domain S-box-containing protein
MSPVRRIRMDKNESTKLKALSDIASIDVTLEFENILYQILKITCESMNAHSGTIMLVDDVTKQLEMAASYGLSSDYIERVYELTKKFDMPITTSPSGIVLETGKYYLVPNVFEEPRDKPWMGLAKELGFSSQIFTPMKKGLKVNGLLNVYYAQVHDFTDEEIDFANIAASQASSVVQNARMCSRLKKNILELKDYEHHLQDKIKKSHNKLFESEAKFHELFDNANDCIYTINLEGQFVSANNSVAKALKCTSIEEVLASNISKWMTPESLEKAKTFLQEILTEKDYYNKSVIIEIICKDGKHVWFENKARPLKDENYNIIEIHGIGRDITEKIRLELELKKSEEKFRDLFENAQYAMYVLDSEGNFLKINQVGLQIIGYTKEEVTGINISKIVTPESLKIVQELKQKCLRGEIMYQTEVLEIVCKNDIHRWIEINNRKIKNGDQTIEIHGIATDITENIKLKQELKNSNKQKKLLCNLIEGSRGGSTRAKILKNLIGKSYNAHQLAKSLNLDYKTIRHHLDVLAKYGIISRESDGKTTLYFISNNSESDLNEIYLAQNGKT